MNNTLIKLTLLAVMSGSLAGCGEVRRIFGVDREVPDEFDVVETPPLVVPPNFELRPPEDGAPAPNNQPAEEAAQEALMLKAPADSSGVVDRNFPVIENVEVESPADVLPEVRESVPEAGAAASQSTAYEIAPSQAEVLANAGNSGDEIRQVVDQEAKSEEPVDTRPEVMKKILFWQQPPAAGKAVNPEEESNRLRQQRVTGDPFTPGTQETATCAQQTLVDKPKKLFGEQVPAVETPPAAMPFMTQNQLVHQQPGQAPINQPAFSGQPVADMPSMPVEPTMMGGETVHAPQELPAVVSGEVSGASPDLGCAIPENSVAAAEGAPTPMPTNGNIVSAMPQTAQELYKTQWSTLGPKRAQFKDAPAGTAPLLTQHSLMGQREYQSIMVTNAMPKSVAKKKSTTKKHKKKKARRAHKRSVPAANLAPTAPTSEEVTEEAVPASAEALTQGDVASENAPAPTDATKENPETTPVAAAAPEMPLNEMSPDSQAVSAPPAQGDTILQPGAQVESIYQGGGGQK